VLERGARRTVDDLHDLNGRGPIAWSTAATASAVAFIGTVLEQKGEATGMAYLRALARQKIVNVDATSRAVLDQVIAGEYAIALQIFNHHAVISAKKGAPVEWIAMEPATGVPSAISVHANAPHPNAAKLLVDFLTSKEGQEIFRAADYLPADLGVAPLHPSLRPQEGKFRAVFFTPEQSADRMPRWKKIFDELFR
jgi:iron(III) transport system substrate-binding protein